MTPKDPFLKGTFWGKFWRPLRSRALLFTPELRGSGLWQAPIQAVRGLGAIESASCKLLHGSHCGVVGAPYRSSKWHYRQRKIILELIMHFIADTDTDPNDFRINFS